MADIKNNFTRGRLNKDADERLIPDGEYIDALNVRVGRTDGLGGGVVKKAKGNKVLTELRYDGTSLSSDAVCIGAVQNAEADSICFMVHDPSFSDTPGEPAKVDMICSYNVSTNILTYHVVSVAVTGNTTLNFSQEYLVNGVNVIDDLLFFTDDYNPPRKINLKRSYPTPSALHVDDPTLGEAISVIKRPPSESPYIELYNSQGAEDFIEESFISFCYRYRYDDNEYSAVSQMSNIAFSPKLFKITSGGGVNGGMVNAFNSVKIGFNSGSKLVKGIDLLFKDTSGGPLRLIEKLDKESLGYVDDTVYEYNFDGSKIFTVLPDSEILRLYDNVPLLAKAQTIMGNRLMYGNYVEGYDLLDDADRPIDISYQASLQSTPLSVQGVTDSVSNGNYRLDPDAGIHSVVGSVLTMDLDGIDLIAGSVINIRFSFQHKEWTWPPLGSSPTEQTAETEITFAFYLQNDYDSVYELARSDEFRKDVGTVSSIAKTIDDYCSGSTLTDKVNCAIRNEVDGVWFKYFGGIDNEKTPIRIISSPSSSEISLQLPAMRFVDSTTAPTDSRYEYYEITSANIYMQSVSRASSLHSGRGYEVGIVYMDDYLRSTTALVSKDNTISVPYSASNNQNKVRVTIPVEQKPPYWATRYKFVMKQDEEGYDTIFSRIFYEDESNTYFLLEGENARKVEEGDVILVKSDTNGALNNKVELVVAEKSVKARNDIVSGSPAGTYMKINTSPISVQASDNSIIQKSISQISPNIGYGYGQVMISVDDGAGGFEDYTIPAGTRIDLRISFKREDSGIGSGCPEVSYLLEKDYIAARDYDDFVEFFLDSVNVNSGTWIAGSGGNYLYDTVFIGGVDTLPVYQQGVNKYYFVRGTDGAMYLNLIGSVKDCSQVLATTKATVSGDIEIARAVDFVCFETKTSDTLPDVFYEGSDSYAITSGFHEGNVQTQTSIDPAIVDLDFFNCYIFGNGVESYKIKGSMSGKAFGLGIRSTAVAAEEYKQIRRYADITYSGVYNDETGVNKLNEFNSGLFNFADLEDSFGPIQVMSGRQTDILVLQEDKISYVLAGKNLLSDAAAGGAVVSTPEVLGTQIARIEEYGISSNPESFASYGESKFFTDVKRGVVIHLMGSSYGNDSLEVISDRGMRTWFRDEFTGGLRLFRHGAFDPQNKEYVLSTNGDEMALEEFCVGCGMSTSFVLTSGNVVRYCVDFGIAVGETDIEYIISGSAEISVIYNDIVTTESGTDTSGTLTFDKNLISTRNGIIMLSGIGDVTLKVNCPTPKKLKVTQLVITASGDVGESIHTEYRYYDSGGYTSPKQSEKVIFEEGQNSREYTTTSLTQIESDQGTASIPTTGSTVRMYSSKISSDTYLFDTGSNKFLYYRTDTVYNLETDLGIDMLLTSASEATPILGTSTTGVYYSDFIVGATGSNLYMIWDYRKLNEVTVCYGATFEDSCCGCATPGGTGTSFNYYMDSDDFLTATVLYTDATMVTKAPLGFYQYEDADGNFFVRELVNVAGIAYLLPWEGCLCELACGETLSVTGQSGTYNSFVELGEKVGVVKVRLTTNDKPVGIMVTYNSDTYNELSAPGIGYIAGVSGLPTYTGLVGNDCDIIAGSPHTLDRYEEQNGEFVDTLTNDTVSIIAGQIDWAPSSPKELVMFIPKSSITEDTLTLRIECPCIDTDFDVTVECVSRLNSVEADIETTYLDSGTGSNGACQIGVDNNGTLFIGKVDDVSSSKQFAVGDVVFSNSSGTRRFSEDMPAGFYRYAIPDAGSIAGLSFDLPAWFEMDANGVVVDTGTC